MKGEEEPTYPNLIAENPGVELETNFKDIDDAMQETRAPSLADQPAAAAQNTNLCKTTGVDSNSKGVHRSSNSFDLKYEVEDDSDADIFPPKIVVDNDRGYSYDSDDESDDPHVPGMLPLMK